MSTIVSLTPNRDRVAHLLQSGNRHQQSPAVDRRTAVNINAAGGSNVHLHFHQHGDPAAQRSEPEHQHEDEETEEARREFERATEDDPELARAVRELDIAMGRAPRSEGEFLDAIGDLLDKKLGMNTRHALPVDPLADFGVRGVQGRPGRTYPAARTARFK